MNAGKSTAAESMSALPDARSTPGTCFRPRSTTSLERRTAFAEPRVVAPPVAVPFGLGAPRNYASVRQLPEEAPFESAVIVQSPEAVCKAPALHPAGELHESAKARVLAALESAKQAREAFLRAADANITLLEKAAAEVDDAVGQGASCEGKGARSSFDKVIGTFTAPEVPAEGRNGAEKESKAVQGFGDGTMSPTKLLARAQEAESQAHEDRRKWEVEKGRLQEELLQARQVAAHASAALERLKLPTEGGGSGETGSTAPVNGSIVPRIEFRNSNNDTGVIVEPIEVKRIPEPQVDKIEARQKLRESAVKENERHLGSPSWQPPVVVHTAPVTVAQPCCVPVMRADALAAWMNGGDSARESCGSPSRLSTSSFLQGRNFSPVSMRKVSPASSPGRTGELGEQEEEEEARMFKDEETRRLLKAELEKLRAWYKERQM